MAKEPKIPDEASEQQEEIVDTGSELSFPASDPPSYMGGTAVIGAPPHEKVHREGVSTELVDPEAAKPAGDAPSGTDPARVGQAPGRPRAGRNNP